MNFNRTISIVKKSTEGLPRKVKAAILSVLDTLDHKTGLAEVPSLQLLVRDLWEEKTNGRKVEPISKDTIRSYLKTMNLCSNGLIQVTSKNKKISVYFPLIEQEYKNSLKQDKETAETNANKTKKKPVNTNVSCNLGIKETAMQTSKESANHSSELYINKNKIINKNINNKISIWLEFEPVTETTNASLTAGHSLSFIKSETQRFIRWNLTSKSKYTPTEWQNVFLLWLEKTAKYNSQKEQEQTTTRKTRNAITTTGASKQFKSNIELVNDNARQYIEKSKEQGLPPVHFDDFEPIRF